MSSEAFLVLKLSILLTVKLYSFFYGEIKPKFSFCVTRKGLRKRKEGKKERAREDEGK